MKAMKEKHWAMLDIVGMLILLVGVLGVIGIIPLGVNPSAAVMVVGIVMIVIASAFIQRQGKRLRKEHEEFIRFDEIRREARKVPNDLEEGYVIDYTAEPSRAISYKNNEVQEETFCTMSDEDEESDILIVH